MKALLLRFWQWLGKLLGVEAAPPPSRTEPGDLSPAAGQSTATPATPPQVTLPPPPPQLDLHAGEMARFSRKASILTKPEERLHHSLLTAVASDYQIMSKVRLWDFLWLDNEPPNRKEHLSRLSCRHVDFLLCAPRTLKPMLVIELDDNSHKKPYTIEADRYKDELFAAAGLPILRLNHPNFPPRQLRERIEQALDGETQP